MLKNSGFQKKMIVYHIVIVLFIMLAVIGIFYRYVVASVNERTAWDFETIVSKTVTQFDNLLYSMDKTALQVAANPEIVRIFQKVNKEKKSNYFIEEPVRAAEVVKLLNSYNFKRDAAARISLYNDYRDFVCTATTVTTTGGMERFFDSPEFRQIQSYFRQEDNYSLYRPFEQDMINDTGISERGVFSVVREIKDYSSNSLKCGYVEVQEFTDKVDMLFHDLGEGACAVILNEAGSVLYESPSYRENGKQREEMRELIRRAQEGTLSYGVSTGGSRYISFKKLSQAPYTILAQKTRVFVMAPLFQFNLFFLLGIILSTATAVVIEIVIIRRLSRPLVELNHSIQKITVDNFRMDIAADEGNDELRQLKGAFNTVLARLREAMDKQYTARTNELKSHLFALQSQMNPHFLYNILAIISMEAQESGNEKTQNICSRLCRMLSFTASMNGGFCTMKEELVNAENYMALMKERYEILFEYEVETEEGLSGIRVPKLIVQPFCENCFKHAFKNKEPVWRIQIRAYRMDGQWRIEIRDNGTGFGAGFLEEYGRMKQEITFENVKEHLDKMKIGGLSIPNIYMRLKLCYGEAFICDLRNDEDGAVVTLGGRMDDSCISSRG